MGPREWATVQGAAVRVRWWLGVTGMVLGALGVALSIWALVRGCR